MDKQQAIRIINETLHSPFDRERYIRFIKDLLNHIDEEGTRSNQGSRIPKAYQEYVNRLERIGKYSSNDNEIMLFIVYLKKETSIDRARSIQRNFIAGYLSGKHGGTPKDAALVAFVSLNSVDWRFSLIKMDYSIGQTAKGKPKVQEEFTPARRWSFLVGANEKSHTAQTRLVPLMMDDVNPSLAELEAAFNIETVTKEFFTKYRDLFIRTKEELDRAVAVNPKTKSDFELKGINTVDFAKKLLGQIVFLYFLQKKGWFGVPRNGEWGSGAKNFLRELFDKKYGSYDNFFNDILELLFYDALRNDRKHDDHYYSHFNCKIPFLNGGLFDPMGNYDWVKTDILLPNDLFSNTRKTKEGDEGDGILNVFDRYNFTVREDEPYEKEVAIDPELLGKTYEKFNAIRPDNFNEFFQALKSGKKGEESKFNKQYGVYYTPREIVHYMCQQSLINYLYTELNPDPVVNELGSDQLQLFGSEAQSGQLRLNDETTEVNIPREDIEALIYYGESVSEHEAHVVNQGRETDRYSHRLPESIRIHAELIDAKLANIRVCDPAVGSGAFPVGMMSEIVRARYLLETFIKKGKTLYEFKRECIENSLYGVDIDPGAVEIAKLRLWLSLIVDEDDIENIKPLPNLDYKIVCGNSLLGVEKNLFNHQLFDELETLKPVYFNETNPTQKQKRKKQIDGIIDQITNGRAEFDFEIYFSEVFHEKGGFDIVIGNPPYVRQEQIADLKQMLQKQFECYTGTSDLFVYFYEKGVCLLRNNGLLVFISSNKYFRSGYGEKLRRYLAAKTRICQLIDFGDAPIFDAIAYPSILVTQKAAPADNQLSVLAWQLNTPLERFEEILATQSFIMYQSDLTTDGWRLENQTALKLLEKIRCVGKPLGEYVNGHFYSGIKTGLNEAFIVDRETRDRLIAEHPSSAEIINPFLRGRDVKRWRLEYADQYLIKIESSENVKHPWSGKSLQEAECIFAQTYPAICAHFKQFREALIRREDQGKYFWELRSCAYYDQFEKPKIIYPDIAQRAEFTYDDDGYYLGNTMYMVPTQEKWLLGILNSKLIYWFYTKISSKIQGDFLRFIAQFVTQIPISLPTNTKSLETLVDRILVAKRDNSMTDMSKLEKEIDQMVYELYGLTEEEIQVAEGLDR
jgi:hypothetical protein